MPQLPLDSTFWFLGAKNQGGVVLPEIRMHDAQAPNGRDLQMRALEVIILLMAHAQVTHVLSVNTDALT